MSLNDVYQALQAAITGGTIDLHAAVKSNPTVLAGLGKALDAYGIRTAFTLTGVVLTPPGTSVRLTGDGSFAPVTPAPSMRATLDVTEHLDGEQFVLRFDYGTSRTGFDKLFAGLLPDYEQAQPNQSITFVSSFLYDLGLRQLVLSASSEDATSVAASGLLDADGVLAKYKSMFPGWPMATSGTLQMPRPDVTGDVIAMNLTAIDKRALIPFGSNNMLTDVGFALRSWRDLDVDINLVTSLSALELIGSLKFSTYSPVLLTVPLTASSDTWRMMATLPANFATIGNAVGALASLIGLKPAELLQPIDFIGLDVFYLSSVEVAFLPLNKALPTLDLPPASSASLVPTLRWLAITIRSDKTWTPPLPFISVDRVGSRWVVMWPDASAKTSTWGGSVFGGLTLGAANEIDPLTGENENFTLDVTALLPQFVVTGRLRHEWTLPIGTALTHFFGGSQGNTSFPDTPSGMSLTTFSFQADPKQRTFNAQGELSMNWELSPFQNLTFTLIGMSFNVEVTQSSVGGGIAASVRLDDEPAPSGYFPTVTVGAQASRSGGSTQWTFEGGLLPGAPLSLTKMALKLLDVDPRSWQDFPDFSLDALTFRITTGQKDPNTGEWVGGEYAGSGMASLRWTPKILGTELRISVSVGASVSKAGATTAEPNPKAKGDVTGYFALNKLALSLAFDFGVPNPTWRFRIQFGQPWVELTTYTTTDNPPHRILTAQLGGVTLGGILEYLVNLAAPTLGYRLDSPWDALNRVDLSRFQLIVDLSASSVELKMNVPIDLGVVQIGAFGVKYTRGAGLSGVELTLDAKVLGEPKELSWDVIRDPPPAIPGKGASAVDLYYLALGQRVRPADNSPVTVRGYLDALEKAMQPLPPGGSTPPPIGDGVVFAADSEWLIGIDIDLAETFRLGLLFNDPNLYGLSVALRGSKAGSFSGLDFQLLYKKISDTIGMFRIDLSLPVAMRSFTIGPVGITLGVIAVEVYTNGNFTIDFGYPWKRDFSRSFTVQYFPFIGRGGIYYGYLNGATSTRVPKITDGTFNPVIELGVGLAVGVGKEIIIGPLSGGAYVQIEVVFLGVFGWFNPSDHARKPAVFFSCNATAAIVGKIYGSVDFKIIKVSVSIMLEAEASVFFEVYKATKFHVAARVTAEAEIKILFIKISFSFSVGVSLDFTAGSDSTPPWTLAAPGRSQLRSRVPALRRSLERRLNAVRQVHLRQLRARGLLRAAGDYWLNFDPKAPIFDQALPIALQMLPAFSLNGLPISWSGSAPANPSPDWRVALLLTAETGVDPKAQTRGARALRAGSLHASDATEQPAHRLIEGFLRWALYAVTEPDPGSVKGVVTALQLSQLADQLDLPQAADQSFAFDNLAGFFGHSLPWQISGDPGGSPELLDALMLPLPPVLKFNWGSGERDLRCYNCVGQTYLDAIAEYVARFQPMSASGAGAALKDANDANREPFGGHVFRDFCLMLTKTAVQSARDWLDKYRIELSAAASLSEVAQRFPTVPVVYQVRGGDTLAMVALALGTTVEELEALNPDLADQLSRAAPGTELPVTLGIAPALVAQDNPDVSLTAGVYPLGTVTATLRAGDSFAAVAQRFGVSDPGTLATLAVQGDVKLLGASQRIAAPAGQYTFSSDVAPGMGAALFFARWSEFELTADPNPLPEADWYAQTLALWNAGVLAGLSPGETIPAGTRLLVPRNYLTDTTPPTAPNYQTVAGDTPLRIGRALALSQLYGSGPAPGAPAGWTAFRDGTQQSGNTISLPAASIAVLPGESLAMLGLRTVLYTDAAGINAPALVRWLGSSPVLAALALMDVPGAQVDTAQHASFAAIGTALGLSLPTIGAALATVPALLPAQTLLNIAAVPAQTIDQLVSDTLSGTGVADIAGQLSRQTLSGLRLPAPECTTASGTPCGSGDNWCDPSQTTIKATGPMTAFGELTGQQIPAPPLDGTSGLSISVELSGSVPWIEFVASTTVGNNDTLSGLLSRHPQAATLNRALGLRAANAVADAAAPAGAILRTGLINSLSFIYTNEELRERYPAPTMALTPTLGPEALPLAALAPQRFGLEHEILLQTATALALPGSQGLTGQPTLYLFPDALRALAHAGADGKYEIVLSAPADSASGQPQILADATFVAAVKVRIQRGSELVSTLVGTDTDGRQVLLDLIPNLGTGAVAYLAVSPDPSASDPSGLTVLDLKATTDAFLIKTNQSTASVPDSVERIARALADTAPQAPLDTADLSAPASFAQLLFEGSVVGGVGYFLSITQRDGSGIPPSAFDSDGRAEMWFVVLSKAAQQSAPAGRELESFVSAALLPPGSDPNAQSVSVIASNDVGGNQVATVAPGLAGFRLQLPNPRTGASDDPNAPSDIHQLFGLVDYQLGKNGGTYTADRPGLAIYPRNPEDDHWRSERAALRRRAQRLAAPAEDPNPDWSYTIVLPLYRFAPASLAPAVPGLPDVALDPYRGLGGASTRPSAEFSLGVRDIVGNASAPADAANVPVEIGYTDALLGPDAWPATRLSYSINGSAPAGVLSYHIDALPANAWPALAEAASNASSRAREQAERYLAAWYQWSQPGLQVAAQSSLFGTAGERVASELPAACWSFISAQYLYNLALAAAQPVQPAAASAQALGALVQQYGFAIAQLALANEQSPAHAILLSQPVPMPAYVMMQDGSTAERLVTQIPPGVPAISATALLSLPANADRLPLRAGSVLNIPELQHPAGVDDSLDVIATALSTSASLLGGDSADLEVLRSGYAFFIDGVEVVVEPGTLTLNQVSLAYANLGVQISAAQLADATRDATDLLKSGASLRSVHYLVPPPTAEAPFETLAANHSGASVAQLAALNPTTPNLFDSGAMVYVGDYSQQPSVDADDQATLAEWTARFGVSAAQLFERMAEAGVSLPAGSALSVPGLLDGSKATRSAAVVPAGSPTPNVLVARFDYALAPKDAVRQFVADQAAMPYLLLPDVPIDVSGASTKTQAGDTFDRVLARLQQQNASITLNDLADAVADTSGLLRSGALISTPLAQLAADASSTQLVLDYGLPADAIAAANIGMAGALKGGVSLRAPDGTTISTVVQDSWNAILSRFGDLGSSVDLSALVLANLDAPVYCKDARLLLPTAAIRHDESIQATPYAAVVYALSVELRSWRPQALILPSFAGSDVETVQSRFQPPGASADSDTRTALSTALRAALPALRLASGRVADSDADLWMIDFGAAGITSVSLQPGAAGPSGAWPGFYALRPLYSQLVTRSVHLPVVQPDGTLKDSPNPSDFVGIDVETWARRYLADVDRILGAEQAVALYRDTGARVALQKILAAKRQLAEGLDENGQAQPGLGISAGLSPVLQLQSGLSTDARQAAQAALNQALGINLSSAYASAGVVQYATTANTPWTRNGGPSARLYGDGVPDPKSPVPYTLSTARIELGQSAGYTQFVLSLDQVAEHKSIAFTPTFVPTHLEWNIQPLALPGGSGYESSNWLTLVPAFTTDILPAAVTLNLGASASPQAPIPLRAFPSLPSIQGQSADRTPQTSYTLANLGLWTYSFSYRHEHAAQDELIVALRFNQTLASSLLRAGAGLDVATSLARYINVADALFVMLQGLGGAQNAVAVAAANSLATLMSDVAAAWTVHFRQGLSKLAVAAESVFWLDLQLLYSPDGSQIEGIRVTRLSDPDEPGSAPTPPGPDGAWPTLAYLGADGAVGVPTAGPISPDGLSRTYSFTKMPPSAQWAQIDVRYPNLPAAQWQNALGSVSVVRNRELIDGLPSVQDFVYASARVSATEAITPLLIWSDPVALPSAASPVQALVAAMQQLYAQSPNGLPISVGIGYGYQLAPGIQTVLPVHLLPRTQWNDALVAQLDQTIIDWQKMYQPSTTQGFWAFSVTLYASLQTTSAPLVATDSLNYAL